MELSAAEFSCPPTPGTALIVLFAAHTAVISCRHVHRRRVTAITLYMIISASSEIPAEELIMGREYCSLADGGWERVCSKLCQSINVCVEHQPACYSFKYERWETGRQSDRQAVGWWRLTNRVQFLGGWRCVCVFQLSLVSVQKSNVSVAGLGLVASEAQTTCQSPRGRQCLQCCSWVGGSASVQWGEHLIGHGRLTSVHQPGGYISPHLFL